MTTDEGAPVSSPGPRNRPPVRAEDLQIAGMQPMSGVDWPGKLVATLFLQGCPWVCPYCHNHAILDPRLPGVVGWEEVEDLLTRRHGLLDGVVFSGGEATRQVALGDAMERVHDLGYLVGLHTAGPYPHRLEELLAAGLVDWVGIDVKALPGDYAEVAGRQGAGWKAWESLRRVAAHPEVDHEVRVTVYPGGPVDAVGIALAVRDMGIRRIALQQARAQGAPEGFRADGIGWEDQVRAMARDIGAMGFEEFTFRPA